MIDRLDQASILDERAKLLARPLVDEQLASQFVEVLAFTVGEERFAIETRFVTEVLHDVSVTPLPGDTSPLVGIVNLRGEVLAVMSLQDVLRLDTAASHSGDRWMVVLGTDRPQFGLVVTGATEVMGLAVDEILPPPKQSRIGGSNLVRGVLEDATVVLSGLAVLEDRRFLIDQSDVELTVAD